MGRPGGRRLIPAFLLACTGAATVWAFSFKPIPPADFTFVNGTEIESVDPAIVTGQPEGRIINAIFEGLTNWHPKTLETMPGVAERWEISPDGLRYTFHLRPDARWSDGSPITAQDFAWSYRRFLDPATAAEYAYQMWYVVGAEKYTNQALEVGDPVEVELLERPPGALPFARGNVIKGILRELIKEPGQNPDKPRKAYVVETGGKRRTFEPGDKPKHEPCKDVLFDFDQVGVEVVDDHTLKLTLKNPTPYFLSLTGFYPLFAVNQRCVETYGYPGWTKPENIVSNGAFRLQSRRIRERIRLVRSDSYWNRANVHLGTIDALACESTTTMVNLYMTGKADWIPSVPATIVPELLRQQRADFRPNPELTNNFYRMNVTRPPLDNPLVRQALIRAIDRKQLVETVTRAGEVPATSLVPPGLPGYQAAMGGSFDPKEARRLLAQAGYPGGRSLPKIEIMYNTDETHQSVAELIQYQWKTHLGINVGLQNQEWNSYLAAQRNLQYQVCRAGWVGDYLDPNTFLDMFVTGGANNQTGWSNKDYDKLIAQAAKEQDAKKRLQILHQAEVILMEAPPIIPLYFRVSKNMVRPYVQGFFPNLQDVHPLEAISVDQDAKRRFLEAEGLQ